MQVAVDRGETFPEWRAPGSRSGLSRRTCRGAAIRDEGKTGTSAAARENPGRRWSRSGRLYAVVLLLLVASCAVSESEEQLSPPNVLLITIDTLRRDHCSVYGYARDTTPHLRRVAESGARFDLAYAPTSETGPTHASIFTGLYPMSHRLVKNGLDLAAQHETLAEILGARGYQTAAFVSSFVLKAKFGFGQGFSLYRDDLEATASSSRLEAWEGHPVEGVFDHPADTTTRRAIRWLWEDRDRKRPFFLFVHYFDPHSPYSPPGPFARRFPPPDSADGGDAPQALQTAIGSYDGEIAFADQEIGRLLEVVDREGLAEDTLLVITADHGEGLMDHRFMLHGIDIYEESVRVPLLFRWPGEIQAGRVLVEPVELVDLVPTILDLIDPEWSPKDLHGRSLARSLLAEGSLDPDRPVYLHRRHFAGGTVEGIPVKGEQQAVRLGKWKYIDGPEEGRKELYDLESDPHERVNRYHAAPDQAARLAEMLDRWKRSQPAAQPVPTLPDDDRGALEALGYVE